MENEYEEIKYTVFGKHTFPTYGFDNRFRTTENMSFIYTSPYWRANFFVKIKNSTNKTYTADPDSLNNKQRINANVIRAINTIVKPYMIFILPDERFLHKHYKISIFDFNQEKFANLVIGQRNLPRIVDYSKKGGSELFLYGSKEYGDNIKILSENKTIYNLNVEGRVFNAWIFKMSNRILIHSMNNKGGYVFSSIDLRRDNILINKTIYPFMKDKFYNIYSILSVNEKFVYCVTTESNAVYKLSIENQNLEELHSEVFRKRPTFYIDCYGFMESNTM